jgi:transposase-like protein
LRKWVRQSERDQGQRDGLSSSERDRLKQLEREVRELKRANGVLAAIEREKGKKGLLALASEWLVA